MTPIALSTFEPFARGGRRLCFVHPHNPARCLKILRTDDERFVKTGKTLVPAPLRAEYDNNEDERRALAKLERQLADHYDHLPRSYGYTHTDLGRALELDLIRDHDGPISRSAREALLTGVTPEELRPAYDQLANHFVTHAVITRAILDHNLAAQRTTNGWKLTLIDGFGDRAWLPLRSIFPTARRATARKRTARGWQRILDTAREVALGDAANWDRSRWGQGLLDHRDEPPNNHPARSHTG